MLAADNGLNRASLARRLLSLCYEALLLAATLAILLLLPHILLGTFAQRMATAPILWAHLFLVLLIYCLGFWIWGGQTLAMKTWRIRLVTDGGRPVRPAQALLRHLLCWPSLLCFGLGLLWAFVDRDQQFLHDRLAGTRLVSTGQEPKTANPNRQSPKNTRVRQRETS